MPRQRISAKYTGENDEHYMRIPARDLTEDEFDALDDDQKALLAASSFYELRGDAPKEAAKAERRVEREAAAEAPADAVSVTVAGAEGPAKK